MPCGNVNIIACVGLFGEIGRDGKAPWPAFPAYRRRFRELTEGGTLVMGRSTWAVATPGVTLGRKVAVVCSADADLGRWSPDVKIQTSGPSGLFGAMAFARSCGAIEGDAWLCGGERIFREGLGFADRVHLTVIQGDFVADTYWPNELLDPSGVDEREWRLLCEVRQTGTPWGLKAYEIDLERNR